ERLEGVARDRALGKDAESRANRLANESFDSRGVVGEITEPHIHLADGQLESLGRLGGHVDRSAATPALLAPALWRAAGTLAAVVRALRAPAELAVSLSYRHGFLRSDLALRVLPDGWASPASRARE